MISKSDLIFYFSQGRKIKQTQAGWISGNAPCCVHNGESIDRRGRGGLKINDDLSWSYSCFNCGFKTSFTPGRPLSFKARRFLSWINIPEAEIERINLESLKFKSIEGIVNSRINKDFLKIPTFESIQIDDTVGTTLINPTTNADLYNYLEQRKLPLDYPYMVASRRPGIVIPFSYNNLVVGHSTRYIDNKFPKYIHSIQPGYVFGIDLQSQNWKYIIVVEGVLDALSINGAAVLHADISDLQIALINSLGKEVIVVPDQDKPGMKLADKALELGWSVSIPMWNNCKDVNDAVVKYGKIYTIMSILAAKSKSKIKIALRKKQLGV